MKNNSLLKGNILFEKYIRENFLKYMLILIVYLIGFMIGISIFSNKVKNEEDAIYISKYITERIESIGEQTSEVTSNFIKQDFFGFFTICILSFCLIGIFIIIFITFIRALSLGITISALIHTNGIACGLSFSILVYLVPLITNLIIILMLVCSSIKFWENIIRYKKETKYEIIRHAIVILVSFVLICVLTIYRTFSLNIVNQILF
ncbi:MAG: stage II sporulation protein M [Clostridia bacterium]|nr:stage II sporulation protein M [Clostridia bacterium]